MVPGCTTVARSLIVPKRRRRRSVSGNRSSHGVVRISDTSLRYLRLFSTLRYALCESTFYLLTYLLTAARLRLFISIYYIKHLITYLNLFFSYLNRLCTSFYFMTSFDLLSLSTTVGRRAIQLPPVGWKPRFVHIYLLHKSLNYLS